MLNTGVFNTGQQVGEEGQSGRRQHRFGCRESQGTQARAFASDEHHSIGGVENVLAQTVRCGHGDIQFLEVRRVIEETVDRSGKGQCRWRRANDTAI